MSKNKYFETAKQWREKNKLWRRQYQAEWRKKHPDANLETNLKKYGLSLKEYKILVEVQNNRCAICFAQFVASPNVDHDHKTGRVRGLTCGNCNRMLGCARDSKVVLQNGIDYLNRDKPEDD